MKEWFENESFWRDTYALMFPEQRYLVAEEQVGNLIDLADFKGHDVLDLCCGPGRHSVILAGLGYRVTGVDRTPFLLDKARARAREVNVEIEWVLEDMRRFKRAEAFDLVINMFTSFGYFDDKQEDLQVLRNMHANLRPNGICVIDVIGKERLARIFTGTTSDENDDGTVLVQRHEIFDEWSRIRNEWILIKDGAVKSYKFHHTIYSGQELKDRLMQAGFGDVVLYGDLLGNEYGYDSQRLIAVARK